jgi:retron-type reverse transcriptase
MGLFSWLRRLLGRSDEGVASVPQRQAAPPTRPSAARSEPPSPGTSAAPRREGLDLNAADFLPIARADLKEQAQDVTRGGAWFGRRDLIPPAEDPRTKLIDRALVTHGLLTPEQLVEIHTVGAEMDRVRPQQTHLEMEVFRSGEAAVQADRERRARLKEEKKAATAKRKKEHADAVARRKATDILFLGRGVSRRLSERVSDVSRLAAQGLPLLSTPAELAAALGLSVPRLRWLAFHTEVATRIHYVQFTVPKKSGGQRTLSAPHKTLAAAQQWIFDNIVAKLPTEPAAHGFVAGRSILTNATPHVGQAVVINADLEDFFPTINFRRVRSVFQRLGYSGAVATILALLCTECPRRTARFENKNYYVATGPRGLPQGACTSPGLSNQVARRLDRRLTGLAKRLGLTYTRYADDLTFSGPLPLPVASKAAEAVGEPAAKKRQGIGYLMARLRHVAEDEGFRIKETKSRVLPRSTAQMVTGVVVNVKPSIRRAEIRRLRAILHRARTEGLEAQNREERENFRSWLEGKIAYVAMVRPDVGAKLKAALAQVQA